MGGTGYRIVSDAASARFPGRARLRVSAEYQAVFTAGRRISSASLRLHAQPCPERIEARLGVVVSKKVDKRAVARNRFKRVIRDYFRRTRADLPNGDYVVIVKPEARKVSADALRDELAGLWRRVQALKPPAPAGTMPAPDAAAPSPPSLP